MQQLGFSVEGFEVLLPGCIGGNHDQSLRPPLGILLAKHQQSGHHVAVVEFDLLYTQCWIGCARCRAGQCRDHGEITGLDMPLHLRRPTLRGQSGSCQCAEHFPVVFLLVSLALTLAKLRPQIELIDHSGKVSRIQCRAGCIKRFAIKSDNGVIDKVRACTLVVRVQAIECQLDQ